MTRPADSPALSRERIAGVSYLRRAAPGAAQALVLLHGIGSNARSFAALMTALPPQIDVIAWNAPGYVDSTPLADGAPAPRDYAEALAAFLDGLGLPRVALVGHSLGALFAASFAAQHPQRVAALALVSPALGYGVAPGAALPAGVQARIDEIVTLGPAAFAAKRAARLVGDPAARPDVVAAVEQVMAAVNPAGYVQAVRALGAGRLLADAAKIIAPTMVAVGAKDQITPPANAREAYSALRNPAGFHAIPDAGHALPQERPEALAPLLARLIESPAHV